MSFIPNNDIYFEVARGNVPGRSVIHKFGRNNAVGTSFAPIAMGGIYRTPQVAGATTLRIKAGDANDTAAGTGARTVTLEGLDQTGAFATESLTTAGASAGTAGAITFMRLFRAWVATSGSYADPNTPTGSHIADVVIENGAGGTDWATISLSGVARGQTEIGAYTVPLGKEAYAIIVAINTEASKDTDVLMYQRPDILQTAAPYSAQRVLLELGGTAGEAGLNPKSPMGPFPALTDIYFMGRVASGSGEVDVDFEIHLVDT